MLTGTLPTSVTFLAGEPTAALSLAAEDDVADPVDEDDSVVTVTVLADSADPPTYGPGTPGAASVTVTDNETNRFTVAFAEAPYAAVEGAGPLTVGIEFVSASGRPPAGPLSVAVATRNGSARGGRDFTAQALTVEVQPGDFEGAGNFTYALNIPIDNDAIPEAAETFDIVLSSPAATHESDSASLPVPGATTETATVTITDDDPAITVAADPAPVVEGTAAAFTLTRTGVLTGMLEVVVDVSETGAMLTGTTGPTSVTFAAGMATATLSLATVDDTADPVDEDDSVVTVAVVPDTADPPTYLLGTPSAASVTVTDDDVNRFTIRIPGSFQRVSEDVGTVTIEIEFRSHSNRPPAGRSR